MMSNFSFTHSVFKRLASQGRQKGVIVWEWVKRPPAVRDHFKISLEWSLKAGLTKGKKFVLLFSNPPWTSLKAL